MGWLLARTCSLLLAIVRSLNGCFYSSSEQKLGEGLAKLRTAREAPSDCMCPPGRCKPARPRQTAREPPARWTDAAELLLSYFIYSSVSRKTRQAVVFPKPKHSLVLETVNVFHCLALACLQIKEFEVWTKATFGYKNKKANSFTRL